MPVKRTIYDAVTGQALERWAIDAVEAVRNDPKRYSFTPFEKMEPLKPAAAAAPAAKPLFSGAARPRRKVSRRKGTAKARSETPANDPPAEVTPAPGAPAD